MQGVLWRDEQNKKWLPIISCNQNAKFDKQLHKPIGIDQDETNSIKASYNKGIHTVYVVIT